MDELEILTEKIRAWNKDNSYRDSSLFTDKLYDAGFDEAEILMILDIVDDTCLHCFDGDSYCQCWNDE